MQNRNFNEEDGDMYGHGIFCSISDGGKIGQMN